MGSGPSQFYPINISLETGINLLPGEQIMGTISFTVDPMVLTQCSFKELVVELQTKEVAVWSEGSGSSETTYIGRHQVTLDRVVLQQYNNQNTLQGKSYSYNFTLTIPNDPRLFPQSFFLQNSYHALVQHRILAYVLRHSREGEAKEKKIENHKDPGRKFRKLKKWMVFRGEVPVVITRPPPVIEIPEYSPQTQPRPEELGLVIHRNITLNEVSAMMKNVFSDGGIVKTRCLFDRDVYKLGDVAQITCNVDNLDGKKDINKIVVKLVQNLQLRAYTSSHTKTKATICKMTDLIHVDKGQQKEFKLSLPLIMDEKLVKANEKQFSAFGKKDPLKDLGSKYHQFLKQGLQPSINANRITCEYQLEVHVRPEGFNATSSLKPCTLPVFLYRDTGRVPIIPAMAQLQNPPPF